MKERSYIAIDLKSFYASVECRERKLDPLKTNLVVADASRTTKTICLAVSPSLKAYGIPGRARLFEVVQRVKEVNAMRCSKNGGKSFSGASYSAEELEENMDLAVDYIAAPPRMALYMDYSTRIYNIYLRYVAPEDIHVYSVDEVFMDVTSYLGTYQKTARQLAQTMMQEVFDETGITATAGIGTNMYLCKIAMDIMAKRTEPDEHGARIAQLDELTYRQLLWDHRPLTDFWRVGRGYAKKLEANGLYTMGDVARCSIGGEDDYYNEDLLYKLFGINAELLIDHAWGWEPCTIAEIKAYRPEVNSVSSGQVLTRPYGAQEARIVVQEMVDLQVLDLVDKGLVTDQIVLTIGYDVENLTNPECRKKYHGEVTVDRYGRSVPKHAHGTANLKKKSSSTREITEATLELFDRIVDQELLIRRITLVANHVVPEDTVSSDEDYVQMDLFADYLNDNQAVSDKKEALDKEKKMQQAILDIKKKYGKNALLRGMNFQEGATARERNRQIGGHKA